MNRLSRFFKQVVGSKKIVGVTACLNERIFPIYRGEHYEEPLNDLLSAHKYGEVTGGGALTSKEGEIDYIDIELEIVDLKKGLPLVKQFLEERGAPKGSRFLVRDGERKEEIPFGRDEGIAIYLDGVNLPDHVYQECDSNFVWEECDRLLGEKGKIRSYWQGPIETAFYAYGGSAIEMQQLLSGFMESYPLCRGARVIPITPTGISSA